MNRRSFLQTLTAAGTAFVSPAAAPREWSFVHFTDLHIQRELKADQGCALAFGAITKMRPDFAVSGGDLVIDALGADRPRAEELFGATRNTASACTRTSWVRATIRSITRAGISSLSIRSA